MKKNYELRILTLTAAYAIEFDIIAIKISFLLTFCEEFLCSNKFIKIIILDFWLGGNQEDVSPIISEVKAWNTG